MSFQTLTLKSIRARTVVLKLRRPFVARIATLSEWPLILIDLYTEEGVTGRSYLEWQDWSNPILQQPYEVKDGNLEIPEVSGVGLEWDEKAVAAHLVDKF